MVRSSSTISFAENERQRIHWSYRDGDGREKHDDDAQSKGAAVGRPASLSCGRISRQGRAHARAMLVEAAWSIATQPGPLRAFFARIKERRGRRVAVVATARKLAVLIWHLLTKEEDYAWTRPALMQWKLRELELRAGRARSRPRRKAEQVSALADRPSTQSKASRAAAQHCLP
jgi:hypothetical protein